MNLRNEKVKKIYFMVLKAKSQYLRSQRLLIRFYKNCLKKLVLTQYGSVKMIEKYF